MELTWRQQQIYDFIVEHVSAHGFPPTVREIGDGVGIKSSSTVHKYLNQLKMSGVIKKGLPGQPRAIALTNRVQLTDWLPILGDSADGQPFVAVEDALGPLRSKRKDAGNQIALKICDDAMSGAGIMDGDMVLVHRQTKATVGDIVIALADNDVVCRRLTCVKRIRCLIPANKRYVPIDGRKARILGKVTAVIRTYCEYSKKTHVGAKFLT